MTEPSVLISKQGKVVGDPNSIRDTHVCIICEIPVAQRARLLPCLHTFCRSCAAQMQSCALCHSAIETVELLNSLRRKAHVSALTLQCYDSTPLAIDPAVWHAIPCASQATPQYTRKLFCESARVPHGLQMLLVPVGVEEMAAHTKRAWRHISKTAPVMGPTGKNH